MRLLQAPRHLLQHISATHHDGPQQSIEPAVQGASTQTAHRHDPHMITARRVSVDPYKAWLEQREADREREAHRLNPRAAWDDLRTQTFCAAGRG
jgi:hypothetical protein